MERHRVGALVCGVAGTVWVRWVAASKVFDDMWARQVIAEHDAAGREKRSGGGGEPSTLALVEVLPFERTEEQTSHESFSCL